MNDNKIKINKFNNIKNKIEKFSKDEFKEIYLLLKKNDEIYSTNSNGILFDLFKLKESTVNKIEQFIKLYEDNTLTIQRNEKIKEEFKNSFKS